VPSKSAAQVIVFHMLLSGPVIIMVAPTIFNW
jgi:hypothetical protein